MAEEKKEIERLQKEVKERDSRLKEKEQREKELICEIEALKKAKKDKKEQSECEKLSKEVKERDEKLNDTINTLKRLQAEFENYSKRCEKENNHFRKFVKSELIKKMLPVLDSFELALKNHQDKEKFMKGVEMIYAQLFQMLEEEGLRSIDALGKRFDPFVHEVLITEHEKDKEYEIITEELQKGYMLYDKVLRYSKVKINKKPEVNENESKD